MPVCGSVLDCIGHTPPVALDRLTQPGSARVLLKLEYFAPGAGMKDRIGKQIIADAEKDGRLQPGGDAAWCRVCSHHEPDVPLHPAGCRS